MVTLSEVQESNSRIATTLPSGLVAVFVGATNGIGEATIKQFAKHSKRPRLYFVGRSQEAGDRIAAECKTINPEGQFTFISSDISLLRNVDDVCRDIKKKESSINLLFLSQGTLISGKETAEGLHLAAALCYYSRHRFIVNLLPELERANALRRVVSCFTATKEGEVDTNDFQSQNIPLMKARGHASSMVTLSLEDLAEKAPSVSFCHNFPGPVKSGIARGTTGVAWFAIRTIFAIIGPFICMALEECGDRHVYLSTSDRYAARSSGEAAVDGVDRSLNVMRARATNGKEGGGVYSIDEKGESAGQNVEELLARLRQEGVAVKLSKNTEEVIARVCGNQTA